MLNFNLRNLTAGVVGSINPQTPVSVRVSTGNAVNADGTQSPAYATPGQVSASIGSAFTASVAGTTMTVSAVPTGNGVISAGDALSGTDGSNSLPEGAIVVAQLTGAPGGVGTYEIGGVPDGQVLNSCAVTAASIVLNVTGVGPGTLLPGQTLADEGGFLLPGTIITAQIAPAQDAAAPGGAGTYSLNRQQTVAQEAMSTSMTLLAQVQAMTGGQLRHMDMLGLQGSHRAAYINSDVRGAVRVALKGGDLLALPDGTVWLVTQVLEPFYATGGWQKLAITLQNGA